MAAAQAAQMAGGAAAGGLSGYLSSKKTAGTDAGNIYEGLLTNDMREQMPRRMSELLNFESGLDSLNSDKVSGRVMQDPVLGDLFKQRGGQIDRADAEEQRLASQGFKLTPEDREAYGQISGDIARQFGQSENSLAQALAARGLSSSGVAGRSFATSQGNKMEQLAGAQRKIANDRMQNTMQRLSDTRSFLSNLQQTQGQQYGSELQSEFDRGMSQEQERLRQTQARANAAMGLAGSVQEQNNEKLQQRQQTQETPGWAKAGIGAAQGAMSSSGGGGFMGK